MKVVAQTAGLQDALTVASSIIATRTPKPVLQCVKLIAAGKALTLLATDLEVGCRYTLTAVQVEQEGEALFITMELVEGKSLAEWIPRDGVSLSKLFEIAIPLADALAAAHKQGIKQRSHPRPPLRSLRFVPPAMLPRLRRAEVWHQHRSAP